MKKNLLFTLILLICLQSACSSLPAAILPTPTPPPPAIIQTTAVEQMASTQTAIPTFTAIPGIPSTETSTPTIVAGPTTTQPPAAISFSTVVPGDKAKYIFLFIGDGMGTTHRDVAQRFLNAQNEGDLLMNLLPVMGLINTKDANNNITDSASSATALATGYKVPNGYVSITANGEPLKTFSEIALEHRWKVGIVTNVPLDNATPAVFYAHQERRSNLYEISMQIGSSGVDYFAGGGISLPRGLNRDKPDAIDNARASGYRVIQNRDELLGLPPGSGKILYMNSILDQDLALNYEIDRAENDTSLAELTRKGIELLDNPLGFFMMVEGGKIDWASHANDAGSMLHEVLALDEAVAEAYQFYQLHPAETLIIVTADHETGNLSLEPEDPGGSHSISYLGYQKTSFSQFDSRLFKFRKGELGENSTLNNARGLIVETFGLALLTGDEAAIYKDVVRRNQNPTEVLAAQTMLNLRISDADLKILEPAFQRSMIPVEDRSSDESTYEVYGVQEPLTVKCAQILAEKSGLKWGSFGHTATPVLTTVLGVKQDLFGGVYENTGIFQRMLAAAGFFP